MQHSMYYRKKTQIYCLGECASDMSETRYQDNGKDDYMHAET